MKLIQLQVSRPKSELNRSNHNTRKFYMTKFMARLALTSMFGWYFNPNKLNPLTPPPLPPPYIYIYAWPPLSLELRDPRKDFMYLKNNFPVLVHNIIFKGGRLSSLLEIKGRPRGFDLFTEGEVEGWRWSWCVYILITFVFTYFRHLCKLSTRTHSIDNLNCW